MKRLAKVGLVILVIIVGLALAAHFSGTRKGRSTGDDSSGLSFNVGKTETHNNSFSSSASSSSDHSTFNSRRVLFVQTDSGRFSERLADMVLRRLTNCPQIEQVDIVKPGAAIQEGIEAPDLFVHLNVARLEHSGLVSSRINATVEGSVGVAPWQSSYFTTSHTTPPMVQFAWNTTIESESKFSGVRSDSYAETLRSIADEFVKGVSNQVATLSEKFPPLPELPRAFYGPYQPVGDFDFLKEVRAKRVCSYYGVFTHNNTFWEFQAATNPLPQLQRIIDQLVAAQWKLDHAALTNTMAQVVRLHQGDTSLEIFRVDKPTLNDDRKGPTRFVVRYTQPFSDAEVEAALETLFADNSTVEMLLPFQNSFSGKQRERFYALLEKAPATNPSTCLQLATFYLERKQTNAAVNMLVRAKALAVAATDSTELLSKVDSLARKISPKETLKLEVTPEICRELSFLEITNSPQRFELERDAGQPVLWFSQSERGVKASALTIHPPRRGVCDWKFVQAEGYGRSSQWSSFDATKENTWRQTFSADNQPVKVAARLLPSGKRLAFTIETER